MIDLTNRSLKKELLDADDIPFADIRQNMLELNRINTLLGGHRISVAGFRALIGKIKPGKTITVCEIGCGGGDNLNALAKYCLAKNIRAKFIGIDIKQECIDLAKQQYAGLNAQWICNDFKNVDFENERPSIIFSSLFCHHFTEEELTDQLRWMRSNATAGFFINDLHRNLIAYYSIKILTAFFSSSYLVKNDAPLSVARSFRKTDLEIIFDRAGIKKYSIKWKWAFRFLIIYEHA